MVFNKDKGVKRVITSNKMGQVLDYPEDKTLKLTEGILCLLTKNEEVPGKVVYRTLFSLLTLDKKGESWKVSSINKRQVDTKMMLNAPTQKSIEFSCPNTKQSKEEDSKLNVEDILEDIDLKLK